MDVEFQPLEATNSCVVNSIAYLKGLESVPEDWMTDIDNIHKEGIHSYSVFMTYTV